MNYTEIEARLSFCCQWRIAEGWRVTASDTEENSDGLACCPFGSVSGENFPGFQAAAEDLELSERFTRSFNMGFDGSTIGSGLLSDRKAFEMGRRFREVYP